jgi:hypothetical protein
VSEGGRQGRPGHAPEAGELQDAHDEAFVPGEAQKDRGWALHDRMRMVRAERQSSSSQIQRSLTAWRKESGGAGGAAAQAKIPKSGGAPLGADVRKSMEGRLGADLSNVKVHTGGDAAGAAEGLRARAFTVGEDVHFGDGEFAPGTKEGDRLLAHELTHVVQGQRSGIQRKADEHGGGEHQGGGDAKGADAKGADAGGGAEHEVSQPGDPAEQEADAVADNVAEGIHGDKGKGGKGKGKEKDKGKDKKGAQAGGHGDDDEEHGHGDDAHGGGGGGGAAKGGAAKGDAKGGAGAEVQQAPPAQISAKLISRKIFRDPKKDAGPPPKTGPGANPANPANASAAGSAPTADQQKKEAEIDARLTREAAAISGAASLGQLGAIVGAALKAGQAAIKLNNVEASVARATAVFNAAAKTDPTMSKAMDQFVTNRYAKALQGQKTGILKAITDMQAKKGTPAFGDVDYGNAQWDATTRTMEQSVLLPENLDAGGAEKSVDVAKKKEGIIKLFSMGQFFSNMDSNLQQLWVQVYGGDFKAARTAWVAASAGAPATCPPPAAFADAAKNKANIKKKDFDKYAALGTAFTKPVTGSIGFSKDYDTIKTIADGVAQLGLRPDEYIGGGFIAKIPADQLDSALANANKAQGGGPADGAKNIIGKPTLFTSLLFAEFNYIAEERVTNKTAVNDTKNTGKADEKGKDELAVVKMPISEFLAGGLTFLPG